MVQTFRPEYSDQNSPFHFWQTVFAPIRKFGKGLKHGKSHFYWLTRSNRIMSFHFRRVFSLICDWSVWQMASTLVAHFYSEVWLDATRQSIHFMYNCEKYLSEGSPNAIHSSVSSANDDDIQSSGIKGRQVVVTFKINKQDNWSHSEAPSQDVVYSWFRKFYKLQALLVHVLDFRNIQVYYLH